MDDIISFSDPPEELPNIWIHPTLRSHCRASGSWGWFSPPYGFLVMKLQRIKFSPEAAHPLIWPLVTSYMVRFSSLTLRDIQHCLSPFFSSWSPCRIERDFGEDEDELMLVTELWGVISKWLDWDRMRVGSVVFSTGAKTRKSHQ